MLSLFTLLPLLAAPALAAPLAERADCTITWKGQTLIGAEDGGVCRYTVKYGQSTRWAHSTAASSTNADASAWAPRCPQAYVYPAATSAQSEDCLYLTIWAQKGASNLPVYAYAPGGSNMEGGSSDNGLNGAALAGKGIVVASVQHRTGVLGFLPPKSMKVADPNFALRDVLLALRSIKDNIVGAGGNPNAVTVGGQSSGAYLAHTLTAVPEAAGLFQRVILESAPLGAAAQTKTQAGLLQDYFYGTLLGGCTSANCAKGKGLSDLMKASHTLAKDGPSVHDGIPFGLTLRPQVGTNTLPRDPSVALWAGDVKTKPQQVLITNTRHEAGAVAELRTPPAGGGGLWWETSPEAKYTSAIEGMQHGRAEAIAAQYPIGGQDMTSALEEVFTAGGFRCPARAAAGKLAGVATVYVAEITQGTRHANNAPFAYCADHVCHNNDIYAWFGTGPAGADAFSQTVMGHVSAFVKSGNPGFAAYNGSPYALGGGETGACPDGFWGSAAKYDFQLYSQ